MDLIERAKARAEQRKLDAQRLDAAAKRSAEAALEARLDVVELERFIALALELAGEEPEEQEESLPPVLPAQSRAAPQAAEAEGNRQDREPPGDEGSHPILTVHSDGPLSPETEASIVALAASAQFAEDAGASSEPPEPDKAPDVPVPAPRKVRTTDRVVEYAAAHPEATQREVAEALGLTTEQVHSAASLKGVIFRKLTLEERKSLGKQLYEARQAKPLVAPAEPAVEPPDPPKFVPKEVPPPAVVDDAGSDFVPPPAPARPKSPNGQKFRLRAGRGEGKYLHMSCVGLTGKRSYAWSGTEQQMAAVRGRFPDARDLYEEPIAEPVPERA